MDKSQEPPSFGGCDTQTQESTASYPPPMYYPPQAGHQGYHQAYPGYYPPPQPGYNQSSIQTNNKIVVTQQPVSTQQIVVAPYQDYMNAAILVTLCCFWPTGILAIIRASDARSAISRGDMVAAASYSRSAKIMVNVSIVMGIITFVVAAIIIGVVVGISANSSPYKYIYSNNG